MYRNFLFTNFIFFNIKKGLVDLLFFLSIRGLRRLRYQLTFMNLWITIAWIRSLNLIFIIINIKRYCFYILKFTSTWFFWFFIIFNWWLISLTLNMRKISWWDILFIYFLMKNLALLNILKIIMFFQHFKILLYLIII